MYSVQTIEKAKLLRSEGNTFREINKLLLTNIPKSTFSTWFKGMKLPKSYYTKIKTFSNLKSALKVKNRMRSNYLDSIYKNNTFITEKIINNSIQKMLLSMLYLGEGSKYRSSKSLILASSDPSIIQLYLRLLRNCYNIDDSKFRIRIQGRYDQNENLLITYWKRIIKIRNVKLYPFYVDKRTKDKSTKKQGYFGVCSVIYFNTTIQIELEMLAKQIIEQITECKQNETELLRNWMKNPYNMIK